MIKINIVCVGKVKENYFLGGIEEYLKRLKKFADVSIIEVKEETFNQGETLLDRQKLIEKEGDEILKKIKGKVYPLCIEGKQFSSEELANLIKNSIDKGEQMTFVIGGSYGLSDRVKNLADVKLSLSKLTYPHTMARLILTEQIYRAFTIINNSSYHK